MTKPETIYGPAPERDAMGKLPASRMLLEDRVPKRSRRAGTSLICIGGVGKAEENRSQATQMLIQFVGLLVGGQWIAILELKVALATNTIWGPEEAGSELNSC